MRKLLGGIHVEGLSSHLDDLRAQIIQLHLRAHAQLSQTGHINCRTRALHAGKHAHQRQVYLEIRLLRAILAKRCPQRLHQGAHGSRTQGDTINGIILRFGQSTTQIGFSEAFRRMACRGRVQHIASKGDIESIHSKHGGLAHARRLRSIVRQHLTHGSLHVQCGETPLAHHLRQRVKGLVALKERRSPLGAKRYRHAGGEKRYLLGFLESEAYYLPAIHRLFKQAHACRTAFDGLPGKLHALRRQRACRRSPHQFQDARKVAVQPILAKRLLHRSGLKGGKRRRLQIKREVQITHNGGNFPAQTRGILVIAQILKLLALKLGKVVVNALHGAEPLEQLRRRLRANARHAGDVVGGIPHKPQEIGELLRGDAIALGHFFGAIDHHVGNALLRGDDARKG